MREASVEARTVARESYHKALAYLTGHPDMERGDRLPAELNLERTRALLERLGRPDRRYPSILIAGTKGKGSTAAMMERALRAAGYRTGLYTQPHLHTTRERIQLDGAPISEESFVDGVESVRHAAGIEKSGNSTVGSFTAYELMTAMAFERFVAGSVDVAVVEVGLGGRLDATNVLEASISVLTSISLDHTQLLGSTLEAIAREKSDIIKVKRPCVSAPQPREALRVIEATARAREAPLLIAGGNGARWEANDWGGQDLIVQGERLINLHPSLRGGFQRTNCAVAATALMALNGSSDLRTDAASLRVGIEAVSWPGRFEVVPGRIPVVLDGAHNVESATRLREAIREEYPRLTPIYVLGIASDKDLPGIMDALCGSTTGEASAPPPELVVVTAARHPRATDPARLLHLAEFTGRDSIAATGVEPAIETARAAAHQDNVLVVTGSLHVVAEARVALGLADPNDEDPFDPWAAP
jgi:dihydrofolate synthase / folylpolyglutamate synthase